jgi:hypothetical protein
LLRWPLGAACVAFLPQSQCRVMYTRQVKHAWRLVNTELHPAFIVQMHVGDFCKTCPTGALGTKTRFYFYSHSNCCLVVCVWWLLARAAVLILGSKPHHIFSPAKKWCSPPQNGSTVRTFCGCCARRDEKHVKNNETRTRKTIATDTTGLSSPAGGTTIVTDTTSQSSPAGGTTIVTDTTGLSSPAGGTTIVTDTTGLSSPAGGTTIVTDTTGQSSPARGTMPTARGGCT